jgi:hypothetical protein
MGGTGLQGELLAVVQIMSRHGNGLILARLALLEYAFPRQE